MMIREFDKWLATMIDTIADWKYYTDFPKVYKNVDSIKVPLNILNSLISSKNIRIDFLKLLADYPEVMKAIPILIAKRLGDTILIKSIKQDFAFDFRKNNYSPEIYADFMENTGLFDLLENHLVANLFDYVTGVEVGLDSNGRKNRTGHAMENLVQSYLENAGYVMDETLFKEINQDEVEQKFAVDLSPITNMGNTQKRFDFVIKTSKLVYLIETNFYSKGGSKLNETARSYKLIAEETQRIDGVEFMWFTDGIGWNSARNNLRETFEILPNLFNIRDLENGILKQIIQ